MDGLGLDLWASEVSYGAPTYSGSPTHNMESVGESDYGAISGMGWDGMGWDGMEISVSTSSMGTALR